MLESLEMLDIQAFVTAPPDDEAWRTHPRCLRDVHGDFQRLYGMTSDFLCLIRPDDHVGLLQRPIHLERLQAYLQQICAPEMVAKAFANPQLLALS